MIPRRILFVDFDGVLNNKDWFVRRHKEREADNWKFNLAHPYNEIDDFDPENMAHLKEIVRQVSDLCVVVSSSWRRGRTLEQLRRLLIAAVPPDQVIGATPALESRLRHEEISQWLFENAKADAKFAALDDDSFDMTPLGRNFFHVDSKAGLTRRHVQAVVAHFANGA